VVGVHSLQDTTLLTHAIPFGVCRIRKIGLIRITGKVSLDALADEAKRTTRRKAIDSMRRSISPNFRHRSTSVRWRVPCCRRCVDVMSQLQRSVLRSILLRPSLRAQPSSSGWVVRNRWLVVADPGRGDSSGCESRSVTCRFNRKHQDRFKEVTNWTEALLEKAPLGSQQTRRP
jgi:hypothetical protein